ncbi:TlpA family protein disulfide reductase [Christiangramia salexigens]|uniref:Thioredoxin domain-containing protein n=1 Tax=Christiangramia salexigens TaxID=1913577 RepID=A0A1L3J4B0_9FLAO|nr:hypothetical protein [Christiangramia salexigens]APG59965.1 hypothetical protein LPB144_05855 [Christiangramia salexigens]
MKYFVTLSLCIGLALTGCVKDQAKSDKIFIGGQINNPETDYVVISRENKVIDTLYLDEKNQFGKAFTNLESGIYTFKHPPEHQILYAEPGDSLVIYLNTLSFDESLNFNGSGAEKSNFLLDMFLKNQRNNDLILSYYKIDPKEFARKTDSIRESRLQGLEILKERNEFSDDFLEIAQASIDYEFYDLRERYSYLIKKYYRDIAEKIPSDFNDYRQEIDFNNKKLGDYYVYTNLIDDYLRSRSIEYCLKKGIKTKRCLNLNSFRNISRRLKLIDSISSVPSIKNEFIDRLATQSIVMAENKERIDSIISLLEDIDYTNIKEAKELAKIHEAYFVGNSLKNVVVYNTAGELINYSSIMNRPTLTYGWSIYTPSHHRWQHRIIKNLSEKYPEIDFLGVNIDLNEKEEWLRTLETFGYDKNKEVQIAKREASKDAYFKYLNKVLLINSDGTIIKGDLQLDAPDLEDELLEFINK